MMLFCDVCAVRSCRLAKKTVWVCSLSGTGQLTKASGIRARSMAWAYSGLHQPCACQQVRYIQVAVQACHSWCIPQPALCSGRAAAYIVDVCIAQICLLR